MAITKHSLKILRYIYHRKSVSYSKLNMQFDDIDEILDSLVRSHYVIQIGGSINQYGEPVPFREDTLFTRFARIIVSSSEQAHNQNVCVAVIFVPNFTYFIKPR